MKAGWGWTFCFALVGDALAIRSWWRTGHLRPTPLVLTLVAVAWFLLTVLPSALYKRMLDASVWHRWSEILALAPVLRTLRPLKLIQEDLDFRCARALIGLGRQADAMERVERYAGAGTPAQASHCIRMASLRAARHDHDGAIELARAAIDKSPTTGSHYVDCAGFLLGAERFREAAEALTEAERHELPKVARAVLQIYRGRICLGNGDHRNAITQIRGGLNELGAKPRSPLIEAMAWRATAFLGIALAAVGELEEARSAFEPVRAYLEATDEQKLIAQYETSIHGSNL